MTVGSDNPFPSVLMVEGAAPATPAAGNQRLFVDTADGLLKLKDDAGVVTAVGSGGSSDLDTILAASSGQDIADALSGAAAPDSGNVFATMADVGGGGGIARTYPLDSYALDGTYGDDFDGASLNARWTRRNFTGGNETYQYGLGATCMRITMTGRTSGDGYFQAVPVGDWTFIMSSFIHVATMPFWSICAIDSSGNGIGTFAAGSPNVIGLGTITTYTSYGGTFSSQSTPAVTPLQATTAKYWQKLRKSGTTYYHAYGLSGEAWSEEISLTSAATLDRIGMMVHPYPYSNASGGTTASIIDVDLFNKIA